MSGERRTVRRERAAAAIDQHRQTPLRLDRMHVRICVRFSEGFIRFAQRRLASGRRAVRKIDFGERCVRIRDNRCVDARELDLPGFAPVQRRRIRSRVVPPPRASAERDQDRDDGSDAHGPAAGYVLATVLRRCKSRNSSGGTSDGASIIKSRPT